MIPRRLFKIGYAALCPKTVMNKVVTEEKAAIRNGKPGSGELVTSLVRAIDRISKRGVLSHEETLGNIFMINFAGLDTTANVLAFTMMRLAAGPEIQDWLHEEIVAVTQGQPVENLGYEPFPRFKRCYAVFLETLRLNPPVTRLPRMAVSGVHTIQVGERSIAIPQGTDLFPMVLGIQTNSRYWDDAFSWKPTRWIVRSGAASAGLDGEDILVPQKGTFFPWDEGPQSCLGEKVSQVEAVAVLSSLFVTHRLRVKREPGEMLHHVKKRVEVCCDDNNFSIVLEMNNTARVALECVPVVDANR